MARTSALRLVQVGLGGWGRDWARRVLPEEPAVEVVAIVDPDPEALRAAPAPAPPGFATLEAALAAVAADAVLVTASLPAHVAAVRAALDAGLHVLVEKPFAPSVEAARRLVELAEARDRILMVSQNYRFYPAPRAVAALVRGDTLGTVAQVEIDFRRASLAPAGSRRGIRAYAQPLLVDMAVHHFDLLRAVLGREPREISCRTWNPPWSDFDGPPAGAATISFDGGVEVSWRGTWITRGPITPWAGEWRLDLEGGEIAWTSRGDPDHRRDADHVTVRPLAGDPRPAPLPNLERIDRGACLHEFVCAIDEGRQPETSGRDNLRTLALMEAAVESARTGHPVSLPPSD